jgi:arylsulfatase A-like enzyme
MNHQVAMTMDWLPTLAAAAGTAPDAKYPSDGMNLLAQLGGAAPVSRKVFWRYRYNAQRAVRDGDLKWLKIKDNTWLFNVVDDPLEKANLKNRQKAEYDRLTNEYEQWNAQMLPEDAKATSAGLTAKQNPDRPNNPERDTPSELFKSDQ